MSAQRNDNAPIRIALLAATLAAAVLLGITSRQGPPFDTYITPGGRLLHCDQLYRDLQAAFDQELRQNPDPSQAAALAYRHVTTLYNRHDADDPRYASHAPGNGSAPPQIVVMVAELNDAYRQCARGRE